MSLLGLHEVSTIGTTKTFAFPNGSADSFEITATPDDKHTYIIETDADVYLRQGDSNVAASANGFLLKANSYIKITVESASQSWLSAWGVSSTGTVRITENSARFPGETADAAA